MRDQASEKRAAKAATTIRRALKIKDVKIGIILGKGWGDLLPLKNAKELPFAKIPGFRGLRELPGHARRVAYGQVAGVPVVALRGRIHLNEAPCDRHVAEMVRLQTEMLLHLGVNVLILTCAASAVNCPPSIGDVSVIDGFITHFAPELPIYADEFRPPEDALNRGLIDIALTAGAKPALDRREEKLGPYPFVCRTSHTMVRSPFFEGRRYDGGILAQTGSCVVGGSVLPEACVAALYPGTRCLGLAFISNGDADVRPSEEKFARAKAASATLGRYLKRIVNEIDSLT